jgi:hypothetical protein
VGIVELCAAVVLSPADALQKITSQYYAATRFADDARHHQLRDLPSAFHSASMHW